MRFTISREKLQEGLAAVTASIPAKTTLPVLANILIEATDKGYVLKSHAPSGRTRVNGEVVDDTRLLADGDRIELGQTRLVFRQR